MAGNVEEIKKKSRGLRGTLQQSIDDKLTGQLASQDQVLIKFHGSYQQDDRDRRDERERKKLERAYSYMIRLRIPAGDITSQQWLDLQESCDRYGTGVLKITTRQTAQIHGILKANLKPTMQDFDKMGLDSIAGCGDVNRNVMASSYPQLSDAHAEIHAFAAKISEALMPASKAYQEIWLDGEKLTGDEPEPDPLYKNIYLPRKFKIGIAIPPHNECDIFTQDIGLIAIIENGEFTGFNIAAGGGMGTTHGNEKTYPRLGSVLGFIPKDRAIDACAEILMIQRDFGNRTERTFARLKYTVDTMGVDNFKAELEKRLGLKLGETKSYEFNHRGDIFDIVTDKDGLNYYTIYVEHGRVLDQENYPIKTALKEIAETHLCGIRMTGNQNIMLTKVKTEDKAKIEEILDKHNITTSVSKTQQDALACVALNTCSLAMAEAQRYLPSLLVKVEDLQKKHGIEKESISIRMTGCPNGCARPYAAEIGFVGKSMGHYDMRLGGDHLGERLNKIVHDGVNETQILELLDGYFADFVQNRNDNEHFGDFYHRTKQA